MLFKQCTCDVHNYVILLIGLVFKFDYVNGAMLSGF